MKIAGLKIIIRIVYTHIPGVREHFVLFKMYMMFESSFQNHMKQW